MVGSSRRFVLHYLQMLVAMVVGMAVLYPIWALLTGALAAPWLRSTVIETLVMATTMSVGMGAWMWFLGHRWLHVLEMSAAMYAAFAVLYPLLWLSFLEPGDVVVVGHLLMLPAMLVAMLARLDVYAAAHQRHDAQDRMAVQARSVRR